MSYESEPSSGGGWETAISTQLLASHCVFCHHPLRDPISVERGYGPECAEKHWMPDSVPDYLDVAIAEKAMRMAPKVLLEAWERTGGKVDDPDAAWRESAETRRQMLSLGLHYGALAVSFGASEQSVVRRKVDSAKQCVAAVQQFALAAGYAKCATRLVDKYMAQLEEAASSGGKALEKMIVFRRSSRPGILGVHTPFIGSVQWRAWCSENRSLFQHAEYKDEGKARLYFRYFAEEKLGFIVNALAGIFGDALVLDPDGGFVALPSMHVEPEQKVAKAAPTPTVEEMPSTEEIKTYAVPDTIKLGDTFRLPDGRELPIQYIDPQRGFVGVGKSGRGGYEFFSFEQVKKLSGREVDKELYKEKVRLADQVKAPTPKPLPAVATKRALPEGMMEHQVTGVQFVDEHHGRALIADEMGLGKTLVACVAMDVPAVVVCPASLKVNWLRELARWRPDLSTTIISGTKEPEAEQKKADVVIINYDIVAKHQDWLVKRNSVTVVADEAHYLKNLEVRFNKESRLFEPLTKVKRTASFYEVQRDAPRLILLTGTPILNRVKELFPLLHMIDPQTWDSGYKYCVRYCGGHYENFGPKQIFMCTGRTNSEELHQKVNNIYMLRRTADVLNLPEKRRGSMTVSLDAKAAAKYERQVREFLKWVEDNGGPEAVMRAMRAEVLVQLNKLRETAAEGKAPAAVEWIENHWTSTARPLVVMGTHRAAFDIMMKGVDELNAAYEKQLADGETPDMQAPIRYSKVVGGMGDTARQAAIDDFQSGKIDLVFYSISLATGTTLTRAQDMLFVERAWRPGDLSQAEARIYRKGQKNQCMITYLDAEGTIDGKIAMLLKDKIGSASAVIEGVNLNDEQASEMVFGELFSMSGLKKNTGEPEDTLDQIADSWFSPLPV
jgi:hypothetical protein